MRLFTRKLENIDMLDRVKKHLPANRCAAVGIDTWYFDHTGETKVYYKISWTDHLGQWKMVSGSSFERVYEKFKLEIDAL